ncbi:DUF2730 family protein [Mesorhizobium sp. DCY119]|nr:DUF2730 family protein [Mesorhizobium sp. DCY119]
MDITPLMPWLSAAALIISIVGAVHSYLKSDSKKAEEKLADHDRRIQSLESDMKHLPDREQSHRMELAIERLSGRVDTLAKSIEPIAAISERWQELILEEAKK